MKVASDFSISRLSTLFWQSVTLLSCLVRPLGFLKFIVIGTSSSSFSERRFLMTAQIGTSEMPVFDASRDSTGEGRTIAFSLPFLRLVTRSGSPVRYSRQYFSSRGSLFFSSVALPSIRSRSENSRSSRYIGRLEWRSDTGSGELFDRDTMGRSVRKGSGFRM